MRHGIFGEGNGNYARCLIAATNKPIQPTIKLSPPRGVIGPKIEVKPLRPIKSRRLNRYREPENKRMPTVKAIKETRID
jgi:hypothetical protein